MAMTLLQLYRSSPANRREHSDDVVIKAVKARKNTEGFPMVIAKVQSALTPKGQIKAPAKRTTYVTAIEFYAKKQVIVDCSCDDFLYTFEYANNMKGCSRIENSNGQPPMSRNPAQIPGMCKHLIGLYRYLKAKGLA